MRSKYSSKGDFNFQIGQTVQLHHRDIRYHKKIGVILRLQEIDSLCDNIATIASADFKGKVGFFLHRLTLVEDEQLDFEDDNEYGPGW